MGAELSFGDAVEILNRLLRREEVKAVKGRTYQDFCHRIGRELTGYVKENTKKILKNARFDSKTGKPYDESALPPMLKKAGANLSAMADPQQTIQTFNASRQSADEQIRTVAFEMEVSEENCYISIDDIGVKHQKEHWKGSLQKQGVCVKYRCVCSIAGGFVSPDRGWHATGISQCSSLSAHSWTSGPQKIGFFYQHG